MPEGDTVFLAARRLDRALAGRTLTASDFRWPSLATVDLAGAVVHGTGTHGKHLLTRLDHEGRALTLHTHLKMEGTWRTVPRGGRWPGPLHTVRVVLRTERVDAVGRSLGLVELLPTADEDTVIGHLGPDLLADDWDIDEAVARLTESPDRVLGDALLDQTVVAGIGTLYLAETCFLHGVRPVAHVRDVKDPVRLLGQARRLLQAGARTGQQPQQVFRRQRRPCVRCGTTVVAGEVGPPGRQRTTYWCPSCQPEKSL